MVFSMPIVPEPFRKRCSDITAGDFREAMESFGLGGDKASADRLYKIYDWRQNGSIPFQVTDGGTVCTSVADVWPSAMGEHLPSCCLTVYH